MPVYLIFQKYFIGFSYGISFPLTIVLLDYWLKDCGVTNATIGIFSILHLPFALKLFLAPIIDEKNIPIFSKLFGRRRSWVILSQMALILGVLCLSQTQPGCNLLWTMFFASFIALADGIQNIALYPYQISGINQEQFGYTAGIVSFGHRIGNIVTKCVTLYCAQFWGWKVAYQCSSLLILACMIAVIFIKEPADTPLDLSQNSSKTAEDDTGECRSDICDLTNKSGLADQLDVSNRLKHFHFISLLKKSALLSKMFSEIQRLIYSERGIYTLLIVLLYKASDFTIQKMSRIFCLDIGFTKIDIANIVQFWGSIAVMLGGFIGGYIVKRSGILKAMMILSFVHMTVLFMYALLSKIGNNVYFLSFLVFFEGISGGAVSAAFIAFLYDKCKNGSQYALLWAIHEIGGMTLRMISGFLADLAGWYLFFIITPLLSIPGIVILNAMQRENSEA